MFVRYLKMYFSQYERSVHAYSPQQRDPRAKCFRLISEAVAQNIPNYLSKLFNEFPLEYEKASPIDPQKALDWAVQLNEILSHFGIDDSSVNEDIQHLLASMMAEACSELFDASGRLKQEIVDMLGLNDLIATYGVEIDYQVLYSYCLHIVFGKTVCRWTQDCYQIYIDRGHDVLSLGPVSRAMEELLVNNNGWTEFFLNQISQGIVKNQQEKVERFVGVDYLSHTILRKNFGLFGSYTDAGESVAEAHCEPSPELKNSW